MNWTDEEKVILSAVFSGKNDDLTGADIRNMLESERSSEGKVKHKPILHIYQDGDQFFAALPDFVDLQESSVVWISDAAIAGDLMREIKDMLADSLTKDAIFQRAKLNTETIDPYTYRGG